jgi:hypothetical protein
VAPHFSRILWAGEYIIAVIKAAREDSFRMSVNRRMAAAKELMSNLPAAFYEHLAPRIASMLVALPIRLKLLVVDDILSMRLGKAVAVAASTSN